MMRRALAILLVLAAGCASQAARKAPVAEPEVEIEQTSGVVEPARHLIGPINLRYVVRVRNVAKEPVTLKRIDLISIGEGAYNVSLSRPFNETIQPSAESSVQIVGSGNVPFSTPSGANGPVVLRATLTFNSAAGDWQTIITQPVRSSTAD